MKRLRKITLAVLVVLYSLFGSMNAFAAAQGGSGDIHVPFEPFKSVIRIWIATKPAQREYRLGERLDLSGMVVKATYSNGDSKVVSNYKTDKTTADAVGVQTVTVTFGDKHATFDITVYVPGDANGNGVVDDGDVKLLQRYIAGQSVQIDSRSADVTGDGVADGKDAVLLQRYLTGWNVDIG